MSNGLCQEDPCSESRVSPSEEPIKRKRGRPKGSKSQPKVVVEVVSERCQRCGLSDFQVLRTDRRNRSGYYEGKPFNEVVIRRIRCRSCHQVQTRLSFDLR
jgi:hypothetical protein